METQSPSGVPSTQSCMCSMASFMAEAAEEEPRAAMMEAAPRLATVGMKSFSIQASSLTASAVFFPATVALNRSGIMAERLPQMVSFLICSPGCRASRRLGRWPDRGPGGSGR